MHIALKTMQSRKNSGEPTTKRPKMQAPERLQCTFFLENKKRRCGMMRSAKFLFCTEHAQHLDNKELHSSDAAAAAARVPCPLDPRHTVWSRKLKAHIRKCNKAKDIFLLEQKTDMPWYCPGLNRADVSRRASVDKAAASCAVLGVAAEHSTEQQVILHSVSILNRISDGEFSEALPLHEQSNEQVEFHRFPQLLGNKKHAIQQSSLIQHLKVHGLWNRPDGGHVTYIEFGCGRAELSRYLNQSTVLSQLPTTKSPAVPAFVLIDRGTNRMKYDKKFNDDIAEFYTAYQPAVPVDQRRWVTITRKKIDIADLNLDALLSDGSDHVAISKHLCGVATDFTIRCIFNSERLKTSLKGVLIAMCCRHACDAAEYVNPEYLTSLLDKYNVAHEGLSYSQFFSALRKIASWAVCGRRPGVADTDINSHFTGLSVRERERLGEIARRVIDEGRCAYFRERGYDVRLFRYCDSSVTLENVAMLVTRRG
ncbi:tRNA:m4X modification enzyme Ecym_2047 [Eremothecium cymbalariae DBVPG|uniref:tRNA:m(4)X modification enzyme TRM13 n=1 Tax=Eremothecium cymbalariae (strain CBS 270.75 / DBVPG 7215 / KCTC 17166 / NRRL Y-17582) TaxID=931890 RepID=G8JP04_ERECY|nr:Hypothetical protein Ecym_2047 [Eremothecium cymbalariae DBVPG\